MDKSRRTHDHLIVSVLIKVSSHWKEKYENLVSSNELMKGELLEWKICKAYVSFQALASSERTVSFPYLSR